MYVIEAPNHYYDAVIAALPHDVSLLLFGPGEAKGEFHQRLVKTMPAAAQISRDVAQLPPSGIARTGTLDLNGVGPQPCR